MMRVIFFSMLVVAIAILTLAAQFMIDDIKAERATIMARNTTVPAAEKALTAAPEEAASQPDGALAEISPQNLNAIETAAGATAQDGGFGAPFTNTTPAALADPVPAPADFPTPQN